MEPRGEVIQDQILPMRRVVVMGPPGAGKSTVARRLGARFDLPVFHLDQAFWRPGWKEAPAAEFVAEVERIAALPEWVIDGNFTATLGLRFRTADTVVYLDIPAWRSMARIISRIVGSFGKVRPDMAAGCPEKLDFRFLRFTWGWNRQRRARNLALVKSFSGRIIILHGAAAVTRFLRA